MDTTKLKQGDYVELVKNDVFAERPFPFVMKARDRVLINTSFDDEINNTTIVHERMIAKIIPAEEYKKISEENAVVENQLASYLFNNFDD